MSLVALNPQELHKQTLQSERLAKNMVPTQIQHCARTPQEPAAHLDDHSNVPLLAHAAASDSSAALPTAMLCALRLSMLLVLDHVDFARFTSMFSALRGKPITVASTAVL
jgi:hypothetical protein